MGLAWGHHVARGLLFVTIRQMQRFIRGIQLIKPHVCYDESFSERHVSLSISKYSHSFSTVTCQYHLLSIIEGEGACLSSSNSD